jgi:hypothetical protein
VGSGSRAARDDNPFPQRIAWLPGQSQRTCLSNASFTMRSAASCQKTNTRAHALSAKRVTYARRNRNAPATLPPLAAPPQPQPRHPATYANGCPARSSEQRPCTAHPPARSRRSSATPVYDRKFPVQKHTAPHAAHRHPGSACDTLPCLPEAVAKQGRASLTVRYQAGHAPAVTEGTAARRCKLSPSPPACKPHTRPPTSHTPRRPISSLPPPPQAGLTTRRSQPSQGRP